MAVVFNLVDVAVYASRTPTQNAPYVAWRFVFDGVAICVATFTAYVCYRFHKVFMRQHLASLRQKRRPDFLRYGSVAEAKNGSAVSSNGVDDSRSIN